MIDMTILIDTAVGRPADLIAAAAEEGIDIVAGCLFPRLGGRVAHVAVPPEHVPIVRRVAAECGGSVADERECVVVPAGFPGGASGIARRLADAGIVINVTYFGVNGEVVIGTSDIAGSRQVLGGGGEG